LVHVSARHAYRGVVFANGFSVRCLQQAVDLSAFGGVVQLNLTNAELVSHAVVRLLRDLLNNLKGQREFLVKIHELGHSFFPFVLTSSKRSAE
jgi:hypothetical protein